MSWSVVELAKKLISYPSVTPDQAGCIDFIEELLRVNGFQTYKYIFGPQDDTKQESVANLYAVKGTRGPNLCFAGHIDVVPPGDESQWSHPPFEPKELDSKLYGRGAVDMKGAIAAAITATLDYFNQHNTDDVRISFLITADEEGPATYGTERLLEQIYKEGHVIDFAILGEPTCDQIIGDLIKIGRRGSLSFNLKIIGEQGHVAYPKKARNPHLALIEVLNKLTKYELDNGNEFFEPSSLQITSIDTNNVTRNVIPSSSTALFNIRYSTEHTAESLIKLVTSIVDSVTLDYQLECLESAQPFIRGVGEFKKAFVKIVEKATGTIPEFSTSGGTSDARFITNYCDFLEFGLLNSTAHKIDEHCKISDLQTLHNVYYMAIEKFKGFNSSR